MKTIHTLIIIAIFSVLSSSAQDKPELEKSAKMKKLIEVPVKPGDCKSDNFLEKIPPAVIRDKVNIFRFPTPKDWAGPTDLSGTFQLAYDDKNLYVKIDIQDNTIVKRSNDTECGDEIEFYIAFPDNENSQLAWGKNMFQLRIIPFDDRGIFLGYKNPVPIPDSQCTTQKNQDGYSIIAALPWKPFNYKPQPGIMIPFDFRIIDSDIPGKIKLSMTWNNSPEKMKPWKSATDWGCLKFVEKFSKSYIDGERAIFETPKSSDFPPRKPLQADKHTIFLANFDKNCDAVSSAGNPSCILKGKAGITSGNKGKFGEAFKPINDYQSTCSYECKNNFNVNEGTLELWFNIDKKPEEVKFPFFWCIRAHPFGGKQKNVISLKYDQRIRAIDFGLSNNSGKGARLIMPYVFKPNEWVHVAVTWKNLNSGKPDAEIRLFVNGKECSDRIEDRKIDIDILENSQFFLGSTSTEVYKKASNPAFASIDDLKISGIAKDFSGVKNDTKYTPKRSADGKLIETRYLCCLLPKDKKKIDHIVSIAAKANYNVLCPSVSPGEYKSDLTMLKSDFIELDFDPLAYMIEEAHKNGIDVHPYLGIGGLNRVFWPCVDYNGNVQEGRLNPGIPKVRDFIINEMLELCENYKIDGIGLDFIRYSFFNYSKDEAELMKKKYGIDIFSFGKNPAASLDPKRLKWYEWREQNIHDIVKRFRDESHKLDPNLTVTAYVWPSSPPRIAQAWEVWSKNNWVDRIIVMNYSPLAGEVNAVHLQSQKRSGNSKLVDSVLMSYKGNYSVGLTHMTDKELARQIQAIRNCNSSGVGHFSLKNNKPETYIKLADSVFSEKAIPACRKNIKSTYQRKQQDRKFDLSSIAFKTTINESDNSSDAELEKETIVGGICINDNSSVKIEFLDNNGNWQFLTEGTPGEFGLASLITFPPVKTKKLRVSPKRKLQAVTPFFGTDQNTLNLDRDKWSIISLSPTNPEKLKGLPVIKVPPAGQVVIEAEKGLKSGYAATIKKIGNRTFADLPPEDLKEKKASDTAGTLKYAIQIEKEGDYELWGLVNGPTPVNDSLFIEFAGRRQAWHLTTHGFFEWRCLYSGFRKTKKYIMFHLKPGKYLLKVSWREPGTQCDKLCIRPHRK